MNNTKFDRAAAKLKENADRLQIPAEDFKAGLDFAAQFLQDNPLTDENRTNYFLLMAIASYHAGRQYQIDQQPKRSGFIGKLFKSKTN